jgi:hypothetical protein
MFPKAEEEGGCNGMCITEDLSIMGGRARLSA